MTLEIITAEKVLYRGDAEMVTLPGELGSFTVLNNHASIISVLVPGKVEYRTREGRSDTMDIKGGIVDVDNNVVSVCVY